MATKLLLHDALNSFGYRGMDTTQGASLVTGVVNTSASGTEIQWTKTAAGVLLVWMSPPVPAAGFTLAGVMTFNLWAKESSASANATARARVYKYSGGVETEVAGGPWSFGTEFTTSAAAKNWTGTPTSTAFAAGDRLVVKYFITNVGTMGGAFTCTVDYDAGTGVDGDSYFQINETVTFDPDAPWPPFNRGPSNPAMNVLLRM